MDNYVYGKFTKTDNTWGVEAGMMTFTSFLQLLSFIPSYKSLKHSNFILGTGKFLLFRFWPLALVKVALKNVDLMSLGKNEIQFTYLQEQRKGEKSHERCWRCWWYLVADNDMLMAWSVNFSALSFNYLYS